MPHKLHGGTLGSTKLLSDLPPNASTPTTSSIANVKSKKSRADRDLSKSDTPRAFSRLFQPYRPPRSSEDDGVRRAKRRKVIASSDVTDKSGLEANRSGPHVQNAKEHLRKDNGGKDPRPSKPKLSLKDLSKASKTRLEKKMQKMQKEWRLEDERLKAKRQKMGEEREGFVDEENVEEMGVDVPSEGSRASKKRKKGKEVEIWEAAGTEKKSGRSSGQRGLVGLHDVVQAPPRLKRPGIFQSDHSKTAAGGLKRQAELSEGRKQVIEGYRAMMKQKREADGKS